MFSGWLGEHQVIDDFVSSLEPGDVVYDIGANLGKYSCFAAKIAAEVIAFEPTDVVADRLEMNSRLNEVDVTVVRKALGDREAEIMLDVNRNWVTEPTSTTMVPGDQLIAGSGLPSPTVLKIDVEGAELDVVHGLKDTLKESVRRLYCEVHVAKLEEPDRVKEELESLGFAVGKFEEEEGRPNIYHLCAQKIDI